MRKLIAYFIILLLPVFAFSQINQTLNSEMDRLKTETVLVVNSQEIDYFPLWSPKSDFIALNIGEEWYKTRLTDVTFESAKWRGQTIGILAQNDVISKMSEKEIKEFQVVSNFNPREVISKNGTKVELRMQSLQTSLIVTKKGKASKTLWTSGGENCHSLVLSPNGNM